MRKRALTNAEMAFVLAMLCVLAAVLVPAWSRMREARLRYGCLGNLKQYGLALRMYARESEGSYFPPPSPYASAAPDESALPLWCAPQGISIFPDYISDLEIARCPSDRGDGAVRERESSSYPSGDGSFESWRASALAAGDDDSYDYYLSAELSRSYLYTGYFVHDTAAFHAYYGAWSAVEAARETPVLGVGNVRVKNTESELPLNAKHWPSDVPAPPEAAAFDRRETVFRLREGIEHFLITDGFRWYILNSDFVLAQSNIPIVWEAYGLETLNPAESRRLVFNHAPGGSGVLYMDGHVEYVRYGAKFPIADDAALVRLYSRYRLD